MEHSVLMATEIKDEIFDCVPSNSFFSSCRSSSRRFQVGIRILFSINDTVMLLPFGSIFFNTLSPKLHRFHMNVLFADNAEALNSATVSFRIHAAPFVIAGRVTVVASALHSGAS